MASSPVAATGVTTAAAVGGALTGNASGLDGLFAALMGGVGATTGANGFSFTVPGATTAVDGTAALATGAGDLDISALMVLQGGQVQQTIQLGEDAPEVTVTGDPATVKAFVAQVKDLYEKLAAQNGLTVGKLSDAKQLAAALTKLGMNAEEATGVAERIQTMLKLVEQQQGKVADADKTADKDSGVDEGTEGTLAAMMLAVMAQQVQPAQPVATDTATPATPDGVLSIQITTVAQTTIQVSVGQAFPKTDMARDMMGLTAGKPAETMAGAKGKKIEVSVTADKDDAAITMTLPELAAKAEVDTGTLEKLVDVTTAPKVQTAQAAAVTVNPIATAQVAAQDVIASPQGDTIYQLQADKDGVETLKAVKPVGEKDLAETVKGGEEGGKSVFQQAILEATNKSVQDGYVANQNAQKETHKADMAAFADRVAQVNDMLDKAQVGKQVAVQIQPLLEQGGGTIKINLHPKDLGHITVELSVHEGKVQGAIAASEPAVVEQLARELHSLRHGLADAGLKLGEQGINLMLSNQGGQQGQSDGRQGGQPTAQGGGRSGTGGTTEPEAAGITQNLAGWVAPDRVLDLNV